jgi:hypothetical protein
MDFDTFSGIVEMDETNFLYSEKGKRNIEGRNPASVEVLLNFVVSATNKFVY